MSVNLQSTAIRQKPNNAVKNSDLTPIVNDLEALNNAGGGISSVTGNVVDNTDPLNPVITAVASVTNGVIGGGGNLRVDNTDAANPVVSLSYDSLVMLVNQTGVTEPSATPLINEIATTWSYVGVGTYRLSSAGLFTANKTFVLLNSPQENNTDSFVYRKISDSILEFRSYDSGALANDILFNHCIEVRVYK
jgi:hypothetical protein